MSSARVSPFHISVSIPQWKENVVAIAFITLLDLKFISATSTVALSLTELFSLGVDAPLQHISIVEESNNCLGRDMRAKGLRVCMDLCKILIVD